MSDASIWSDSDVLVDAETAGHILGLKVATIRRLTYERRIPCVHPTGKRCVRYRLRDLQKHDLGQSFGRR